MKTQRMKLTTLMILLSFTIIPLLAQQRGPGQGQGKGPRGPLTEEDVKERVNRLAETLELSDDQKQKVLDYELENRKTMQEKRKANQGDREAMRAVMMEQRELRDSKYAEILNDDQMAKYKEIQEKRAQQRQQRQGKKGDGDDGERRQRGRN